MTRILGFLLAAAVAVMLTGFLSGVFDVSVNDNAKDIAIDSSREALDKAQRGTDHTFKSIRKYLEENK